jgi:acetyltransferase-like isoleucine patch superfamily enzyme
MTSDQKPKLIKTEKRELLDPQGSAHGGFAGLFETLLRRFKVAVHALTLLPFYAIAAICLGLAGTPGVLLMTWLSKAVEHSPLYIKSASLAVGIATSYFLYGFALILVVPVFNLLLVGKRLQSWRGPYYSLPAVRWYIHNGLAYLVRYTFLPFITPTPYGLFFFRAMGMRIGKGVVLNSEHISDPSLITIEDKATIGGSVTIIAHYGVGGYLVISPVRVCAGATVGIKATLMAGAEIGANAKILPHSVVLPKTKVPSGETWGGVPARRLDESELRAAISQSS